MKLISKSLFTIKNLESIDKQPNINPDYLELIFTNLGIKVNSKSSSKSNNYIRPEDLFYYIYAVFHSPTYRTRYAEFLKIDFPRVPLTSNLNLFWKLSALGGELVNLHLLDAPQLAQLITRYPVPGGNLVDKGYRVMSRTSSWFTLTKNSTSMAFPRKSGTSMSGATRFATSG